MAVYEISPSTTLGRKLEEKRHSLDLTKEEFAVELGVSKPAYLGWLRGVQPKQVNIDRIAEVLDEDWVTIAGWVRNPEVVRSLNLTRAPLSGRQTVDYETNPTLRGRRTTDWDGRPIEIYSDNDRLQAA